MRRTLATIGVLMAMHLPTAAAGQTRIAQEECSATYAAGEWELEVFYQEPGLFSDQRGVGYHYEHRLSGFSVTVRMFEDRTMLPGYNLDSLLQTAAVRDYFEDIPSEADSVGLDRRIYAGELIFAVVDHERSTFWSTTGFASFGWNAFEQRELFMFDAAPGSPEPTSMIRRLSERDSDEFELQLDFRPDGGSVRRLRAIPVSTSGMVALFGRSQDYAGTMMRGCPAAAEG